MWLLDSTLLFHFAVRIFPIVSAVIQTKPLSFPFLSLWFYLCTVCVLFCHTAVIQFDMCEYIKEIRRDSKLGATCCSHLTDWVCIGGKFVTCRVISLWLLTNVRTSGFVRQQAGCRHTYLHNLLNF